MKILMKHGFRLYGISYEYHAEGNELVITIDNTTEKFDLSALVNGNDYQITDCLLLPYMPVKNIHIENETAYVDLFFDDWYISSPQVFERTGIIFTALPTAENDLGMAQNAKLAEIASAFENAIKNGYFSSTTLDIQVDCRRNDRDNDIQNVQNLIAYMEDEEISSVTYYGYEQQTAPATLEQLKILLSEMRSYGVFVYDKKRDLQSQVNIATTISEVKAITW